MARAEFLEWAGDGWAELRGADGSQEWPLGSEKGWLQLQGHMPTHLPVGGLGFVRILQGATKARVEFLMAV